MSRSKLKMILFFILCCILVVFTVLISTYYYPKLPSKIAVVTRDDGSIATKWNSSSLYILSLIYVSIFLATLLIFKFYDKIKFKNKPEFEKLFVVSGREPVNNLIKESIFAIAFFLGLCILYLQVEIVKLGLQAKGRIRLIPLAFIFLLFLVSAFYYNKKIEKLAKAMIDSIKGSGTGNGK